MSKECLLRVCAYLNTYNIPFSIKELDICLDMYCSFKHVLATCIKRTPNTRYYKAYEKQAYSSTKYLEKVNPKKPNLSTVRSYTYNKTKKEDLNLQVTRFEIKLNSRFFIKNTDNLYESIDKQLNRYYVMYINNMIEKSKVMKTLDLNNTLSQDNLLLLGFSKYRLHIDNRYVWSFLLGLFDSYMVDFRNIPTKIEHDFDFLDILLQK